jgi:miniconductance mechanosensitive channel
MISLIQDLTGISYDWIAQLIAFAVLVIVAILLNLLIKRLILRLFANISERTKTRWDNMLVQRRVFHKLANIIPMLIFFIFAPEFPELTILIRRITSILMVWIVLTSISAFLRVINDMYMLSSPRVKDRPIKGYLQILVIFFYILGIIVMISVILGKSPWLLISGLGAMTAFLLLIFKDTILSIEASLLMTHNDLLKIGDWLEVPQYSADGVVTDISLHTIKIQNWDMTISIIPSYKLIDGGFVNWRGMQEAGGRRIKRSIHIDISSVKFCNANDLQQYEKINILRDYLNKKKEEIDRWNKEHNVDENSVINARKLTNLGTFRAYISEYLKRHPQINNNIITMVRHLTPTPTGIPIEIYAFTNDTRWVFYESIQADIFDHLLSIIPEFGLRVYQYPAGHDLKHLHSEYNKQV